MAKLSFVVLLAALVSFCAAQNNEIGNNKELLGHPKNVAVNWDKFMVRLLRELNLPQKPSPSIDEKQDQGAGIEDVVKANGNKASQSCSSTTGCTATASETNTSSSGSSTGTSSTSTGTSSSSSSGSSSSTSTGTGSSSSSSSSGSSSSGSSSSSSSSSG
ncbi:uncharacterized protein DDB_G0271670-like [Daphnia pulicaria]|uniref:uncharacterized protein DDB_G0271670-like n=1 Tax=Daphnia pulicaria TaxID=35523 RepID=UPI001EEBDD0D|nr:uncharacterized protein DDB_G0271670-like [Daphnia pulicaria]